MEYVVGLLLALFACGAAKGLGLDRDRALYPTMLIVIASYYVLFAAMGAGHMVVWIEAVIATCFAVVAVLGFKRSLWFVVAGLFAHGVQDGYHDVLVHNSGVPAFWPGFCLAFDIIAAIFLACLLKTGMAGRSTTAS